jgi:hypothetical protein
MISQKNIARKYGYTLIWQTGYLTVIDLPLIYICFELELLITKKQKKYHVCKLVADKLVAIFKILAVYGMRENKKSFAA